jgi:hypothetical protein
VRRSLLAAALALGAATLPAAPAKAQTYNICVQNQGDFLAQVRLQGWVEGGGLHQNHGTRQVAKGGEFCVQTTRNWNTRIWVHVQLNGRWVERCSSSLEQNRNWRVTLFGTVDATRCNGQ